MPMICLYCQTINEHYMLDCPKKTAEQRKLEVIIDWAMLGDAEALI